MSLTDMCLTLTNRDFDARNLATRTYHTKARQYLQNTLCEMLMGCQQLCCATFHQCVLGQAATMGAHSHHSGVSIETHGSIT
jgi:hypothetical protein